MRYFSAKMDNSDFLSPDLPEKDFGFEIPSYNVGIRISILVIPYIPLFRQMGNFDFLAQICPKMDLGL